MLESHEIVRSPNRKRQVLVAANGLVDREAMSLILQDEFEVLLAEDGRQAMQLMAENASTLSLVLLDLALPVMSGQQVLGAMADDPALRKIPVIALTTDRAAEAESLDLGAADVIAKPYPDPKVIRARIRRTIELYEDRQIIQATERQLDEGRRAKEPRRAVDSASLATALASDMERIYRTDAVRREQELATALRSALDAAYRDALTGVKSKLAYAEDEAKLDALIASGNVGDFAVVLCDVNDLKSVNDTLGHAEGDELLRAACRRVCAVFSHSPVYRYGGDEFVALLRGGDFERRGRLMARMAAHNDSALASGDVVVACGMAEYQGDPSVASVFERADTAMYEDKRQLKQRS